MDWDRLGELRLQLVRLSFNSPVGIRWIGTERCQGSQSRRGSVSIPQSEFDGLGPVIRILVRTVSLLFQFPSRNSMDWDHFVDKLYNRRA